jgi:hypothetical protein
MKEEHLAPTWEDEIWLARESLVVQHVVVSHRALETPYAEFRLRVL